MNIKVQTFYDTLIRKSLNLTYTSLWLVYFIAPVIASIAVHLTGILPYKRFWQDFVMKERQGLRNHLWYPLITLLKSWLKSCDICYLLPESEVIIRRSQTEGLMYCPSVWDFPVMIERTRLKSCLLYGFFIATKMKKKNKELYFTGNYILACSSSGTGIT